MHLIIDGYNLLAVITRGGRAAFGSEAAREFLLDRLAAYRRHKGHVVTVVFDGWQHGYPLEGREHRSGVQVLYSRRGEQADIVIRRMAEEFGADCAIVSSDREVGDHAKSYGAFVISAQEFAGRLGDGRRSVPGIAHKELDDGEDERPRRSPDKRGNPRKLPKNERRRNRRLNRF
ncbi:hypothetical protein W02_13220 [Nitrospira sp. KM1]|uniref:NYN domain-containing protein n=1 Tax=Nitrospira sp. KM1 TaxID=1936990 RepID=UPI0013A7A73F|nr:NYN domain-containing protein [Nitrospira sp. KM1]BCA54182.1 hypothetical protein W02_13220 [Nitrospira sp. KM1]